MKSFTRIVFVCLLAVVASAARGMDDAKLKEWLSGNFIAPESMRWEEIDEFKKGFSVTDEQLYRKLMGMYREAENKWATLTPKTPEWNRNSRTIEGVLSWLPKCGDIPVKEFLMSYATTKENDSWLRESAILSYLREANAEEAKNALLGFLVEGDRMDNMARLGLYSYARSTYDAASPEKQAAILAALIAAANKEEGKIEFMKVDKILAERSAAYRRSRERLAMLERHGLEPPTTNLYTDRDLKAALEESRKYKSHTSITTNLSSLKTRNFNLPQLALATNDAIATVDDHPVTGEKSDSDTRRSVGTYVFFGLTAILLLVVGAWKLSRR